MDADQPDTPEVVHIPLYLQKGRLCFADTFYLNITSRSIAACTNDISFSYSEILLLTLSYSLLALVRKFMVGVFASLMHLHKFHHNDACCVVPNASYYKLLEDATVSICARP